MLHSLSCHNGSNGPATRPASNPRLAHLSSVSAHLSSIAPTYHRLGGSFVGLAVICYRPNRGEVGATDDKWRLTNGKSRRVDAAWSGLAGRPGEAVSISGAARDVDLGGCPRNAERAAPETRTRIS